MAASHRLSPRTALVVETDDNTTIVYLSHLPTAQIVVAPSPGSEIILGALGRDEPTAHPDTETYLSELTARGLLVRTDDAATADRAKFDRILVSAVGASPWRSAPLPPGWRVVPRPLEIGRPAQVFRRRVQTCWRLVKSSRDYDAVVLSAGGYETLILGVLRPFIRCAVVVHDPLLPTSTAARRVLEFVAAGFDAVWCIRTADLVAWRRARSSCFIPYFAAPASTGEVAAASRQPNLYSGGVAHRNFTVVIDAARELGIPTTIGTSQPLPALPENVRQVALRSAAEGRAAQQEAGISVFVLQPTVLAAGPTVLLDAMAVGAAIVCNDAPGHRDYVTGGVDALVVPAVPRTGDIVRAIQRLVADPQLRASLGAAARERAAGLAPDKLIPRYLAEMERVLATAGSSRRRRLA